MNNSRTLLPPMLVICLAVCGVASGDSQAPKFADLLKTAERSPVVVCFGDSVTGTYYHTGAWRAYTDMLKIALEQAYPDVSVTAINAGISGNTTVDALARIDTDVIAHKPDLVTVMFGLNDMGRLPIEEYRANLNSIVDQCRAVGAEVLLCTPNSVRDTEELPIAKLKEYVAVVRDVSEAERVPVVDCFGSFESIRDQGELEFDLFMSDEIHPNMDGHKRIAEDVASTILGTSVSLDDTGPLPVAIPHVVELLNGGELVRVLAMPPYDALLPSAINTVWPGAEVSMETWPVIDRSIASFYTYSKDVRAMELDLVFVAVPIDARGESTRDFIHRYSWVLNFSISYEKPEWDCVAVPPSLENPELVGLDRDRDEQVQRLIRAQDLGLIERDVQANESVDAALVRWFRGQRAIYSDGNLHQPLKRGLTGSL